MRRRLSAALMSMLLAAAAPSNGVQTVFRTGAAGVRVDVSVSAGGRPVTGLTRDDFEVRDNGIVQTVRVFPRGGAPVRVVLALDTSSSVRGERLEHFRDAARTLVGALERGDEAGLITFDRAVVERVPVSRALDDIGAALVHASGAGETALVDATLAAVLAAEDDASRSVVVVFSDGADTTSFTSPGLVLDAARAGNSVVYAVWSGRRARPRFLREVTAVSGGRLIELRDTRAVSQALLEILREFRQRYLLTYSPTGVPETGWHRIEVRVKRRGAVVRAREGYFGRPGT